MTHSISSIVTTENSTNNCLLCTPESIKASLISFHSLHVSPAGSIVVYYTQTNGLVSPWLRSRSYRAQHHPNGLHNSSRIPALGVWLRAIKKTVSLTEIYTKIETSIPITVVVGGYELGSKLQETFGLTPETVILSIADRRWKRLDIYDVTHSK